MAWHGAAVPDGASGVRLACHHIHGEPIASKHVDLDVVFITRAKMNRLKIATLLLAD